MRIVLAAIFVLFAGTAFDSAKADPYRWCAIYGGELGGSTNCYFLTLQQCEWTISGMGGFCARNLFYDGRPVVTPEDGPARRPRPSARGSRQQ